MIHVRKRTPRQNLQAFAVGGGVAMGGMLEGHLPRTTPNLAPARPAPAPAARPAPVATTHPVAPPPRAPVSAAPGGSGLEGHMPGTGRAGGMPMMVRGGGAIPEYDTGGGVGQSAVTQPVSAGAGAGNYVTPPTPQPSAIPAAAYSPIASAQGGISATAQGLPSARPAVGYTQGPQSNNFGSWGQQAEGGGYNSVAGNAPQAIPPPAASTYQRASTRGTYGSYTPTLTPGQSYSAPAQGGQVMSAGAPYKSGGQSEPFGFFYTGAGKQMAPGTEKAGNPTVEGGATPKNPLTGAGFAAGGAVPDPGGAIPETDPGEDAVDQSAQQNDPVASAQAALSYARKANGLNDEVFNQLWAMNTGGGMPSKPAGPGGDQPNPNPFPVMTPKPPFGKRASQDDTTSAAGGGAIPEGESVGTNFEEGTGMDAEDPVEGLKPKPPGQPPKRPMQPPPQGVGEEDSNG